MSVQRKGPVFLFIIIVLSLLLLKLSAQTPTTITTVNCIVTGTSVDPGTCIVSSFSIAIVALLVSLLLLGIIYIAGMMLNSRSIKQFYNTELWEIAKSCIIIIIIFSALTVASAIAVSLSGQATPPSSTSGATQLTNNLASLYTSVDTNYLQPQLQAAQYTFGDLISLSVGTDLIEGTKLSIWFPIPIPCPPCGGVIGSVDFGVKTSLLQSSLITSIYGSPSASLATAAADGVITIMLLMQVQHDLIYAIAALGLGVLIPVGIVLRAIPFLRGIGGTLIAMGIGIAIIYPALLIGFNLPVSNYLFSLTSPTTAPYDCSSVGIICTILINPALSLVNSVTGPVTTATGYFTAVLPLQFAFGSSYTISSQATQTAGSGFWVGVFGPFENTFGLPAGLGSIAPAGGMYPALNFVLDNTLGQFVQFLLFIIDIIMGYAITNGIARLLGGSISLGVGKKFTLA